MTFDQLWAAVCTKNPDLRDGNSMRISCKSFRESMKQAWEMGEQHAKKETAGIFDGIFGAKK